VLLEHLLKVVDCASRLDRSRHVAPRVLDDAVQPLSRKDEVRLLRAIPQPQLRASAPWDNRKPGGAALTQNLGNLLSSAGSNDAEWLHAIDRVAPGRWPQVLSAYDRF
jgi:hypothetical protein